MAYVGRCDDLRPRCHTCGRPATLWQAALALPAPFPGALDAAGGGCTRAHAVHGLPADWTGIATVYALVAAALRQDSKATSVHEALARRRSRQAERALLLSRLERPARRVALELWRTTPGLGVDDTETIVTAVLAPAQQ
ncbi:hypothetical protein [Geodermatophilus telluris]|uniref:hypothetical protein n=1 Tax=Geodermatophilus telluris TaxID=1190417 RepID=UPI000B8A4FC5|nr:hypothetical protein [Geodermatophilus telluris]